MVADGDFVGAEGDELLAREDRGELRRAGELEVGGLVEVGRDADATHAAPVLGERDENVDRTGAEEPVGDAAEAALLEPALSVAAEDEEVGAELRAKAEDLVLRVAPQDMDVGGADVVRREEEGEFFVGEPEVRRGEAGDGAFFKVGDGLDDVDGMERRAEAPGALVGEDERADGLGREADGAEDGADGSRRAEQVENSRARMVGADSRGG